MPEDWDFISFVDVDDGKFLSLKTGRLETGTESHD